MPFTLSPSNKFAKTNTVECFVSVIIAAHNEAENLPVLLKSLQEQEYIKFEVIIANDRSTDETDKILTDAEKQWDCLKVVHISEVPRGMNPKKYALQSAIKIAQGEILLLTDADCEPCSPGWITNMVNHYGDDTEIVLGFSDYSIEKTLLNKFIRWETFYTAVQYFSLAFIGFPYMGVGRNLSYKKSLFKNKEGFKGVSHITGGDDDLFVSRWANKENTSLAFSPETQTLSVPKKSIEAWFKQKHRHLSVGVFYPFRILVMLGIIQVSYIFFYLLLVVLLFIAYKIVIVASVYLFRILTVWIILDSIAVKFYGKQRRWQLSLFVPIFELFYVAYYIIAGIAALTNRNIKWK